MKLVNYPSALFSAVRTGLVELQKLRPVCFQRAAGNPLPGWQASLSLLCASESLIEILD